MLTPQGNHTVKAFNAVFIAGSNQEHNTSLQHWKEYHRERDNEIKSELKCGLQNVKIRRAKLYKDLQELKKRGF